MEDRKNNCGLLILFTFVFGVLLGLLVSPDSGEKNRLKLKYKTGDLVDSFKSSIKKFLKYLHGLNLEDSSDEEGEKIIKETIDKADQIMNEI
jgi:gas vesicle protein